MAVCACCSKVSAADSLVLAVSKTLTEFNIMYCFCLVMVKNLPVMQKTKISRILRSSRGFSPSQIQRTYENDVVLPNLTQRKP